LSSLSSLQSKHADALRKAAEARARGDKAANRKWSQKAREYQSQIAELRRASIKTTRTKLPRPQITRYHVLDAKGKMHYNLTEAEKDKLVAKGGKVKNVVKIPGYEPPPEAPEAPTKTLDETVIESRVRGLEEAVKDLLRQMAEGKITKEDFLRRKAALEGEHLRWAKETEARGWKVTEKEREKAKELVTQAQLQVTENAVKEVLRKLAGGKITREQAGKLIKQLEKSYKDWYKQTEKGEVKAPKWLDLITPYQVVDLPKQYVVTYKEGGVEKQRVFDSEDAARAFMKTLEQRAAAAITAGIHRQELASRGLLGSGEYQITVTENGKTTTHTFKNLDEAMKFVNNWKQRMVEKYGKPGQTWEEFQREQRERAQAITDLTKQGVIRQTKEGKYEIVKPLTSLTDKQEELAKKAGFELKLPEPQLEKWFPVLKEIRERAKFKELPSPEDLPEDLKEKMASFAFRQELAMKDVDAETLANRLAYVGAYGVEGAAIGGALAALSAAAPGLGTGTALALLLPTLASVSTKKGRNQLIDYVRANPHAFIAENIGMMLGSAAVSKLMKKPVSKMSQAERQQYEELKRIVRIKEDVPQLVTKAKVPKEIAEFLKAEMDPYTGEVIAVGQLKDASGKISLPAARRYGGELFAKLLAGQTLDEHIVEETIMNALPPEKWAYLELKGYDKPFFTKLTPQQAADLLWKELGVNSPWAHIPRGVIKRARGTFEVTDFLRPLDPERASYLLRKGQDVFSNLVKSGVDKQTAEQIVQLAMENGPVNALIFAKQTGKLTSSQLNKVASILKNAPEVSGSLITTLKQMGLSDKEALMVMGDTLKSNTPKNVSVNLQKLEGEPLKAYTKLLDPKLLKKGIKQLKASELKKVTKVIEKDLLLETLPEMTTPQIKEVLKELDIEDVIKLAPKLTAPRLNLVAQELDKEGLNRLIREMDEKSLKKFDERTLEIIAKNLNIKSIEEFLPKLDFDAFKKIFPKLELQKKNISDREIYRIISKLNSAALVETIKNIGEEVDPKILSKLLSRLDKKDLEAVLPKISPNTLKPALRFLDKEETWEVVLNHLDPKLFNEALKRLDRNTIFNLIPKLNPEVASQAALSLKPRDLAKILPKLSDDTIEEIKKKISINELLNTIEELEPKEVLELLPKLDPDTITAVLPKLDPRLQEEAITTLDLTSIGIEVKPPLKPGIVIGRGKKLKKESPEQRGKLPAYVVQYGGRKKVIYTRSIVSAVARGAPPGAREVEVWRLRS